MTVPANAKNIAPGARFGAWTVLGPAPRTEPPGAKVVHRRYRVRCERCGEEGTVVGTRLRSGASRMCDMCRRGLIGVRLNPGKCLEAHIERMEEP